MRGRKRTPTVLRVLRGNPGRRPLPSNEPQPAALEDTAPAPAWLDDAAKLEWARVAPVLARNGLLTEVDVDALTAYCTAWTTWKEATLNIRKFGLIIKSPNGHPIQSPYLPIANKAMTTMRALMTEFGMTPSARSRVTTDASAPQRADDPFAQFDGVRAP